MFKQDNFGDEIYRSMETALIKKQAETQYGLSKLAKVVDLLNTAATIFDQANMKIEADKITEILQALVEDL